MLPELYFAGGVASNCKMERAVTDFPEPDSPTIATVSFRFTENDTFFTACVTDDPEIKSTERFSI